MEYLEAGLTLGLPVMMMSWWVHSWLIRQGLVSQEGSHKETDATVKELRKSKEPSAPQNGDYWTKKWLRFGGGFYGLTALWTFIVIELQGLWSVLSDLPATFDLIFSGPVNLLVSFLQNQAMAFAHAFSWVVNWGDSGFSLIWFFSAYAGFYLGMKAAKVTDIRSVVSRITKRAS